MPQVSVDRDVCQGHAQCVFVAPDLFDLDDDGVVQYESAVSDDRITDVRDAADACPTGAITVND